VLEIEQLSLAQKQCRLRRTLTFPEYGLIVMPVDLVERRRGGVVDTNLNLDMVLQLLDLRQTFPVSVLVEHHDSLYTRQLSQMNPRDALPKVDGRHDKR